MKKILSSIVLLIGIFTFANINNLNAGEIDTNDISNSTYIIGKSMFTRETTNNYKGYLTTDVIMLAAKTIDSNNLEDMIIYYKNARGLWFNALTNELVDVPTTFEINYKNNDVYLDTPTLSNPLGTIDKPILRFDYEGAYSKEGATDLINGYELYELIANKLQLIETKEGILNKEISLSIGTTKSYKVRVYAINAKGEKVYSDYSDYLTLTNSIAAPNMFVYIENNKINIGGEAIGAMSGNEVYEKVGNTFNVIHTDNIHQNFQTSVDLVGNYGKTYAARTYILDSDGNKVYSDYSEVKAEMSYPTITTAGASGSDESQGILLCINSITEATGIEVYSSTSEDGEYTLYKTIKKEDISSNNTFEVSASSGQHLYYKVRKYIAIDENTYYVSEFSNVLNVNNFLSTPVLNVTGEGESEGVKSIILTIDNLDYTSGIEVYSSTSANAEYTLLNTITKEEWESHSNTVSAQKGEHLYFKVRKYAISDGTTYYSEFSNFVELINVSTPTLSNPLGTIDKPILRFDYEGAYSEEGATDLIDGYELYKVIDNVPNLVETNEEILNKEVTIEKGVTEIYTLRVYVLNSRGEKVYSNYSNYLYLTNHISTPNMLLHIMDNKINIGIISNGSETEDEISGYEVYEKTDDNYKKIYTSEGPDEFTTSIDLKDNYGKTYATRAYIVNSDGNKVFSYYTEIKAIMSVPTLIDAENDKIEITQGKLLSVYLTTEASGIEVYCSETEDGDYTLYKTIKKEDLGNLDIYNTFEVNVLNAKQLYFKVRKYIAIDENIYYVSDFSNVIVLDSNISLASAILRDNPTISERTDFSETNTNYTTGTIYKTDKSENRVSVYYYSGITTNNWVKFGKINEDITVYRGYYSAESSDYNDYFTMDECTNAPSYNINCSEYKYASAGDDIWWRIIRTNEDGSVRLLYSGNSHYTNEGYIGTSFYNNVDEDDPMYVGYMYGTSGSLENNRTNENDSTIKTYIDTWYESNLLTNYDKYISKSAIYCNDRSIGSGTYSTSSSFYYGAHTRLFTDKDPTYNCSDIRDAFSVENTSAQLKYPIALMTADELSFAGGVFNKDLPRPYAWYYANSLGDSITGKTKWYLMTPNARTDIFDVSGINKPGLLYLASYVNKRTKGDYIRPVISLDKCAKVTGTGTVTDPYVVDELNSTCE